VDQRTGRNGPKIWHDALTRILCQYFGKKSAKVWGKKDDMNANLHFSVQSENLEKLNK